MNQNFGQLKTVPVKEIWSNEASDFTPWVATDDGLQRLGDTLDIELVLETVEKSVGPFKADVVCKDSANDSLVLIENQLEKTDHTHLGQLMTYASGLKAVTVVWIAPQFTEQHRAALDWLNEMTADTLRFFGVEIEALKIADSLVSPHFKIVSKPNNWAREVKRRSNNEQVLTSTQQLQFDYWTMLGDYVSEHGAKFKAVSPQAQNQVSMGIGKSNYFLNAIASTNELRAELYLSGTGAKDNYQKLLINKEKYDRELSQTLSWHDSQGQACTIFFQKDITLNDRISWDEYIEWHVKALDEIHEYFSPIIRNM